MILIKFIFSIYDELLSNVIKNYPLVVQIYLLSYCPCDYIILLTAVFSLT